MDRITTIIPLGLPGLYLKRGARSVACLLAACLAAVPALAQHALILSGSPGFSSKDHLFADDETIYIKVQPRTDLDPPSIVESSFRFEPVRDGDVYEGTLDIQDDGSLTGRVDVSALQGRSTVWLVTVRVRDEFDHGFETRSAVAVRGRRPQTGTFKYVGFIQSVSDSEIAMGEHTFALGEESKIHKRGASDPAPEELVGRRAAVIARPEEDRSATARELFIDGRDEIKVVGRIETVTASSVMVDRMMFAVNEATIIERWTDEAVDLDSLPIEDWVEAGMFARVHLTERADGTLVALRMKVERRFERDDVQIVGRIDDLSDTEITARGFTFAVTEATEMSDRRGREVALSELRPGELVKIDGERNEAGQLKAEAVTVKSRLHYEGRFVGIVTATIEDTIFVDGVNFRVTEETIVEGASSPAEIAVGDRVKLRYRRRGDGTRVALYVRLHSEDDSATAISGAIDEIDGSTLMIASVPVYTTAGSRIENENGDSITISDLDAGLSVAVRGSAFGHGMLAELIRVEEAVVVAGAVNIHDPKLIRVVDREYLLDDQTLIIDRHNVRLNEDALKTGAYVEVVAVTRTSRDLGETDGGTAMSAERVLVMENSASTSLDEGELTIPDVFTLKQNHPNPFNPSTTITFEINRDNAEIVSLSVFDVLGRKVRTLVDGALAPGMYSYVWNGRDEEGNPVASGIYLYRLEVDGHAASRSMTLIK